MNTMNSISAEEANDDKEHDVKSNKGDVHQELFDQLRFCGVPSLDRNELVFGKVLGSGAFCTVVQLERIILQRNQIHSTSAGSRYRLATSASSNFYAIKTLHEELAQMSPEPNGLMELIAEAKMLSNLQHNNIVTLHGISSDSRSFFLILDLLECTLLQRMGTWRINQDQHQQRFKASPLGTQSNQLQDFRKSLLLERIQIALDLASTLEYLHARQILFRDFKPDNIGFDMNGTVKLFDFGLAKELDKIDGYLIAKQVQSKSIPRYVAPEIVLLQPYSKVADTYSFMIVMWEMFSLKQAFWGLSETDHLRNVIQGTTRPALDPLWPTCLSRLLTAGWDKNVHVRPSMKAIGVMLERSINQVQFEELNADGHGRTMPMRQTVGMTFSILPRRGFMF